ncbi:hypothetical protein [Acetobacterium tundrae]|uniref:Gram-positive cocci surface proteins LPxTG domain-containing protein n=1 Tax=Acetobacterium tundrae TaxID=132932 RepID=A0ABR6WNR3_9FIRM|nr:hypothetical protein [Acetobacterium tundrae]MBC3797951.1 hypothetical protein [Acetobacterium tundrae]
MKKLSKLMSLMTVMVMMFMLVPVSALAASSQETASVADNSNIVISEVVIADTTTVTNTKTVAEPTVTADKIVETSVGTEQPAVTAFQDPVAAGPPVNNTVETPIVTEETLEATAVPFMALYKTDGSEINVLAINSGEGYAYNTETNALTLNNFTGKSLLSKLMGDNFAIILQGTNTLKTDNGFAIDIKGDVNLSGPGTLVAEGESTTDSMGGGINVIGNLAIDSGTYNITAIGNTDDSSVVGILTGYNDSDAIASGNLTINGGNVNVAASNAGTGGAFGLFAYGNNVINDGNIDVFTDCSNSFSSGVGSYNDLVFNGGDTTVNAVTNTGTAVALFSYSGIKINHGILDLSATGGISPLALSSKKSVQINSIYGDVDVTASSLYLTSSKVKSYETVGTFKHSESSSANPKTGIRNSSGDVLMASMLILSLIGVVFAVRKRDVKS